MTPAVLAGCRSPSRSNSGECGGRRDDARKGGCFYPGTLYLMGNAHQQMAQERHKKLLLKLNPSLKFMAEDRKNFESAAPMLFGEEFAKSATTRVNQVKAMKKISKPEDRKGSFPDTTLEATKPVAGVDTEAAVDDISHTARDSANRPRTQAAQL